MATLNEPTWAPTPHPDYRISDQGHVINLATGRVLKAVTNGKGYLQVHLGRHRHHYVHHLVAAAFLGTRPAGTGSWRLQFVNNDPTDCRAVNLRWATVRDIALARWARHRAAR